MFGCTEEILRQFRLVQHRQIDTTVMREFFIEGKSIESFDGEIRLHWEDHALEEEAPGRQLEIEF